MKLLDPLVRRRPVPARVEQRFGLRDYLDWLSVAGGGTFPHVAGQQTASDFRGSIDSVHKRNGVVAAAAVARMLLVSQMRFVWRNTRASRSPGRLWGSGALGVLERPGEVTLPTLLGLLEMDVCYGGSGFVARVGESVCRLDPSAVTVVMGSQSDPVWAGDRMRVPYDAKVVKYYYQPGTESPAVAFEPWEVARWTPEPDPVCWWRGVSWVSSLVRELGIDNQVTGHQEAFFAHAATPSMVFVMDAAKTAEQVKAFADLVNEDHSGAIQAHKNLFLGGGTDVKVVGSQLESLGLRDLSGGFETRVAARSRVPAVVLGVREGMQGSALNSGNYQQTRRLWADGWFAAHAQGLCAALETIVAPPAGTELTFDSEAILFLQEDEQDAAQISMTKASAIRSLVEAGYDPDAVVEAVDHGDVRKLLGNHSGLFSVQLQPAGAADSEEVPS